MGLLRFFQNYRCVNYHMRKLNSNASNCNLLAVSVFQLDSTNYYNKKRLSVNAKRSFHGILGLKVIGNDNTRKCAGTSKNDEQELSSLRDMEGICWNCKNIPCDSKKRNYMICAACGYLQDVDMSINFFDLFDLPKDFEIESNELRKRFRQLQALVHPDKFSNKDEREQRNSANWSSFINKAYKTLLIPIDRGQYMLNLNGMTIPEENSSLDKNFLMEMMERNEEVDDADSIDELNNLNKNIVEDINEQISKLGKSFKANNLNDSKDILIKMKYSLSIQNSIKTKLQSLTIK